MFNLGPPLQEGCGRFGESPTEGNKNDQGVGARDLLGEDEGIGLIQCTEEKNENGNDNSIQLPEGGTKEDGARLFSSGARWQNKK